MRALALVLVALLAHAQEPESDVRAIPEPAVAKDAWVRVLACSNPIGVLTVPGGDLKDVHWFTAKLAHTCEYANLGRWAPPDSIIIDERAVGEVLIVAHELLHQRLRGPPFPFPGHPFVPFAAPCNLMAYQVSTFDADGVLTFPDGLKLYPRSTDDGYDIPTSLTPARVDTQPTDGTTVRRAVPR